MGINEKLKILYDSFMKEGEQFVAGGLIDEPTYSNSNIKIVSLLKEPNDPPAEGKQLENWSLCNDLKKNIQGKHFNGRQMWRVLGTWIYALQYGFDYYKKIYDDIDKAILGIKHLGVTNLKKTGGFSVSDNYVILEYAQRTSSLWMEEIKIMAPDIVLCAGTYPAIEDILKLPTNQWLDSGVRYGESELLPKILFIDFYHPAYRISPYVMYAYLKETFRELFSNGSCDFNINSLKFN
ncbi:MAG: hypothetical protein WC703_09630 [Candidatus Neomarinimicrobiota bacterium]